MKPKEREEEESPSLGKFLEDQKLRRVPEDLFEKIIILVIAALGLITALAWDKVLKQFFEQFFGATNTLSGKLTYAVLVTLIAALVSVILGRRIIKRRRRR